MTPIMRQISDLKDKSFAELKKLWLEYNQTEAPPYRRGYMIRALAYRIQELTYGGLSPQTARKLDELIAEAEGLKIKRKSKPVQMPVTGTRLIREWRGERHEVVVLPNGFEYAGRQWKSLSAIAELITGTHWNGLMFFGLRRAPDRSGTDNKEAA